MRVPSVKRSSLKYPLDDILGSPGLVRLLRILLFEVAGTLSAVDAARMAGLSQAGGRKALIRLARMGIIERTGTGRTLNFSPKREHPFLKQLQLLFETEHESYQSLIAMLQESVTMPEVISAWISSFPMEIGQALQLEVVVQANAIGWIREELRSRLIETERKYDLIVELTVFTRADEPKTPKEAIVLCGLGGESNRKDFNRKPTLEDSELRSLKLAKAIADLILLDPSLIKRTYQYTNRLLNEDQGMAGKDIAEWRQLLEAYSTERVRDLLVSSSSRALRLRRSMPFLSVLNNDERDKLLAVLEKS